MRFISSAIPSGIRVPRNVPPPAGNRPRFTSGNPNSASDEATITSQLSSSSKPPATAVAFAAPTSGIVTAPSMSRKNARVASSSLEGALPVRGERAQVHPGAERLVARPGEDDRADLRVRLGIDDRRADAPDDLGVSALRASGRLSRATRTDPRRSRTSCVGHPL